MTPAMQVVKALPTAMVATSLPINNSTVVSGDDALVKGGADWDIFGEYSADIDDED